MKTSHEMINDLLLSLKALVEQQEEPPEVVVPDLVIDERPIIDNRPTDSESYPNSRAAAKRTGRKYYMMGGKPCKNGHFGLRHTHNAQCVTCRLLLNAHFFGDGLRPRLRRWSKQGAEATKRRAEAMAKGEKYYDAGSGHCLRGHDSMRYTSSNGCVACQADFRKTKSQNFDKNQQKLIDACTKKLS